MTNESSLLQWLQGQVATMQQATLSLANINSGSGNVAGITAVNQEVTSLAKPLNACHQLETLANFEQIDLQGRTIATGMGSALRIWKRPEAPRRVLLVGHTDTVFGPEHPFQDVIRCDDRLLGPGVADMKGGIAVMLWGLQAFEQLPGCDNLGWEILLTPDEEIGSPCSSELVTARAKLHEVGFVFEPALDEQGTLAGARKGSGKFSLVMQGQAAHAGRKFAEGHNAITALAGVIKQIDGLNQQRPGVTLNVGLISGGQATNVVPDCCVAKLDVRVQNQDDSAWVQAHLERICSTHNHAHPTQVNLHGGFARPAKPVVGNTLALYQWASDVSAQLGPPLTWIDSGGVCDGNTLSAAGLPNIDTLGVRGGGIHSPEEYCITASLCERAQLLLLLLANFSKRTFVV